jgi:cyclic pyranopterin phosphate synthase
MPFVNLILEPNGEVGFCRQKGTEFTFGNIQENSIWEIWNGERVRAWRREFLEGNIHTCSQEIKHRACNLCPHLNEMRPYASVKEFQPNKILRLTANLNGRCNLQCPMCDVWKLPNGFYNEDNFWKPARKEIFPFLKEVDLLSGEPFIQADTYKLMREISTLNTEVKWSITTNAHWRFSDFIVNHLDLIQIKHIIFSVDSLIPEVYSKVRSPGNSEIPLQCIQDFKKYNQSRLARGLGSINFKLNFVVQGDNWQEVGKVIDFCLENSIGPFLTFLYAPESLSLLNESVQKREEILSFFLGSENLKNKQYLGRVIAPLLDSLSQFSRAFALMQGAVSNFNTHSNERMV